MKLFVQLKNMITFLAKHPIYLLVIIEIIVFVILYGVGFRITYIPKLENDWEAISACGTWFCGIVVPVAVVFIQHKISVNESNVSASNEALLQEINNLKQQSKSADIDSISEEDIYRYICIKMSATTEEIAIHFNTDINDIIPMIQELFFVKKSIRTCSLEDDPQNNIEKCCWRRK